MPRDENRDRLSGRKRRDRSGTSGVFFWIVLLLFAGGAAAVIFWVEPETMKVAPPPPKATVDPYLQTPPDAPPPPWQGPRPPRPDFPREAATAQVIGPLTLNPVATVYLVRGDTPARARIKIQRSARYPQNRAMVRVFDADERLTHWQYGQVGLVEPVYNPRDDYVRDLPDLPLDDPGGGENEPTVVDASAALAGPGVHQIRLHCAKHGVPAAIALSAPCPDYGISFQNGVFTPWAGSPRTLYAYVPPRAEKLRLSVKKGSVRVKDAGGALLYDSEAPKADGVIAVTERETVWTFELPETGRYEFAARGFPLILCTTPSAAKAIRASVEVLDDGTVVCHKIQRRIAELLPEILSPEKVGRAEDLIVPLKSREEGWQENPLRNVILCGYSVFPRGVRYALLQQNVDPESRWGGLFTHYDPPEGVSPEAYRWDNFLPVPGIGGARTKADTAPAGLAKAALTDDPLNPYFGKTELLYRAAACALRNLLKMDEADIWVEAAGSTYPTGMTFPLGQKTTPAYARVCPEMPSDIRQAWTEALRRLVDRSYTDTLVSCRNQSSHSLVINEEFAHGSEDPVYTKLSRLFARHFADGANAPGYFQEACGPCGSYIGMTHWHMGVYYRMSGDEYLGAALSKSYRFFNHTVAPEPGGRHRLGGFNFNHRVAMGFHGEQYNGAKGIADNLAEVGLHRGPPRTEAELADAIESAKKKIRREINNPRDVFPGRLTDPRWFFYEENPNREGTWPAREEAPFIRDFNGELFAVKRPGYYTCIYAGKPVSGFYIRGREKFRLPRKGELSSGHAPAKPGTPFLGGGLSFFWTPAFGTSLLATNQTPLAHHGLVAWTADGRRWWEEYHAQKPTLDAEAGTLSVQGRIEKQGIDYERRYAFGPDAIDVTVTLTATRDVALQRLVECFPFVVLRKKKNPTRRGEVLTVEGETDGKAEADRFRFARASGAAVEVVFDEPRALTVRRDGFRWWYDRHQTWRVEVELPAAWKKGETATLAYRIGGAE